MKKSKATHSQYLRRKRKILFLLDERISGFFQDVVPKIPFNSKKD